jgi:hypothetical protein
MARRCSICHHPDRAAIEKALVQSEPVRDIAARFGTSASAVHRHKTTHLAAQLAKGYETAQVTPAVEIAREAEAHKARDLGQAIDVAVQLRAINAACLEILQKSRTDGKHSISLGAVDRIHRQLELQSRLLGELQDGGGPTVNVLVAPEWHQVRVNVLQALIPFPEARAAVAEVLTRAGS